MFPLGSVLFPHMPLALRLFEPRYLVMLGRLLDGDLPQFGAVLIERGQEVGGGDQRFRHGTLARIDAVSARSDHMSVLATGTRRFRVVEWLPDDPYPKARIELLPTWRWDPSLDGELAAAEAAVRRSREVLAGDSEGTWPEGLAAEASMRCWQVAGLAPLGELDRLELLRSDTPEVLLDRVRRGAEEAALMFGPDGPGSAAH